MMKCFPVLIFSVTSFAASANPHSVSPLLSSSDPTFYLYVGAGNLGMAAKNSTFPELKKQNSLGIGIGHDFSPYFALEGTYQYLATDLSPLAELRTNQIGLSLIPSTGELGQSHLKLFTRFAVHLTDVECKGCTTGFSENGLTFDLGAGIQWNLNHQFQLRGEYIANVGDSSLDKTFRSFELDGYQVSLGYRY